jgi:hypothetical protein
MDTSPGTVRVTARRRILQTGRNPDRRRNHPHWTMPGRRGAPYGDRQPHPSDREDPVNTRRSHVVPFDVAEDGAVELPDGALIISLEFESAGPYGYESRPVRAWVQVPAES